MRHRSPSSAPLRAASRLALVLLTALVAAGVFASAASAAVPAEPTAPTPTVYPGNPGCSVLGTGYTEVHVEGKDVEAGDHDDDSTANDIEWTISNDLKTVTTWSSSIALDAVIVKGGDAGNAYVYTPSAQSGGGLTSPLKNGKRPDISNIKFCWKPKGKIIIVKDVLGGTDGQDFTFTTQSPQGGTQLPSSFKVDDDGAGDNFAEFSVVAGSYTVTESDLSGWSLDELSCDDGGVLVRTALVQDKSSTVDFDDASATFEVDGTETITCTWVNKPDPEPQDASITVVKKTNPAGDPSSFPFTIDDGGTEVASFSLKDTGSKTTTVDPGVYEIDEAIPGGWSLDGISCVDTDEEEEIILLALAADAPKYDTAAGTAEVEVEAGDNIECTYTNRKQRGTIRVEKLATPADATAFPFTADGPGGLDESFTLKAGESTDAIAVDAGAVTIDEAIPAGWRLKSVSCTGGGTSDLATGTTTVDVSDAENVTCTYTNEKIPTTTTTPDPQPAQQQVQAASIQVPQQQPVRQSAPSRRAAGRARLQGPSGCVARPFSVRIRGQEIESVAFFVGNRRVRTLKARAAQAGSQVLTYRLDPKSMRQGRVTRVTARVVFTTASGTRTRTLRLAVQRCRAAVAPKFTG
jgi:hypothetical protein